MPSKQNKSKKSKSHTRRSNHAAECSRLLASAEKQSQTGGLILSRIYAPDIGMSPTAIIQRDKADLPLESIKDTPTITPLKDIDESWDILEQEDYKENGKFDRNFTGEDIVHLTSKSTDSDQWVVLKATLDEDDVTS